MPQAKQTAAETQAAKRERERKEKAEAAAKGYKQRDGKPFDSARGYVSAQFDIAVEVHERYEAILKERSEVRGILRGLHSQRLLTPDEAVLMFEMFPEREAPKRGGSNGTEAAEATPAAA